jgi:hypothetical protein
MPERYPQAGASPVTLPTKHAEDAETPPPEETWRRILESYRLDRDQAEALTRIVAIRAEAWRARCRSLIRDPTARSVLSPSPTDPIALRRGLELYLLQLAEPDRDRPRSSTRRGGSIGRTPRRRVASP